MNNDEIKFAANNGDKDAQYSLGFSLLNGSDGLDQDLSEANKWFHLAAKQGHTEAQLELGNAYFYYGRGVQQSSSEALKWFRMAAERGCADAQNNVGSMYGKGIGTELNYEESVRWLEMAAVQGHAIAQNSLGLCYLHGNGVRKNLKKALSWLLASGDRPITGYIEAKYNLGLCYSGSCLQGYTNEEAESVINQESAIKWFKLAAERDHTDAQFELGRIYLTKGLCYQSEKDKNEARKWLKMAARNGHERAAKIIVSHFPSSQTETSEETSRGESKSHLLKTYSKSSNTEAPSTSPTESTDTRSGCFYLLIPLLAIYWLF
jgi:TPR repeat protein